MAKTKFSINKGKLVEEQQDGYILTRVPNSNMEYYWLLNEKDIVSSDEKTIVVEYDSEQDISITPRVYTGEGNNTRRPTLQEAVVESQEPTGSIQMKAGELYKDYYKYDKNLDPEQRAERQRIVGQKQQEALARSDASKNMKQQAQDNKQTTNTKFKEQSKPENVNQQETPLSPAQKMEQQRAQIQHYSKQQFKEILKGTRQRLNTSLYQNINLNHQQMKELRLALKAGLDVSKYNSPFVSAKHMKEIRMGAKRGVQFDMEKLDHSLYNAEQMHELRLGFEKKLDVKRYINPAYSAAQMKEIRLGLQTGFDTGKLEDIHLTAEQMHSVRIRMVMDNLEEILKRTFEDIRSWLHEKIEDITEILRARYQNREPMTPEQIKEFRINEAVEDIKYTLVQSELLSESVYDNKEMDEKMKESIREWQDYLEQEPEQSTEQAAKEATKEVCEVAGVEMEQPEDEKVINIQQDKEIDKSMEQAVDEAVEEAMRQEAYEMDQEIEIEEETWAMMQ